MTVAHQEVLVVAPPGIVLQNITVNPSDPCIAGTCTLTVNVTWMNNGNVRCSFIPNITIDNFPIEPASFPLTSLDAGMISTHTFIVSGLCEGTHTIYTDTNI